MNFQSNGKTHGGGHYRSVRVSLPFVFAYGWSFEPSADTRLDLQPYRLQVPTSWQKRLGHHNTACSQCLGSILISADFVFSNSASERVSVGRYPNPGRAWTCRLNFCPKCRFPSRMPTIVWVFAPKLHARKIYAIFCHWRAFDL